MWIVATLIVSLVYRRITGIKSANCRMIKKETIIDLAKSTTETRRHKNVSWYPEISATSDSLSLKEEEQLYLIDSARNAQRTDTAAEPVKSRYHQSEAAEKIRGAVYTPPRVAAALTRWAVRTRNDKVLDPACGEGVFLSAARTRLADLGARRPECLGVDIDQATAAKSGAICADFFKWLPTAPKVDVVVGNPPFIRSHLFPEASRTAAFTEMVKMGLRPSRLMSTWAPFLALCCKALNEHGRLAMVIPEELLAVGYATGLRRFLLARFKKVIICFPSEGIFPGVQQAVVLLLCDNEANGKTGLLTIDYSSLEEGDYQALNSAAAWQWNQKWTHLFLSSRERTRLNDWWPHLDWQPFSSYGRVEVGIVTGDNHYFILNRQQARSFNQKNLVPIVTSAKVLRGIRFGADDFKKVLAEGCPALLLNLREPKEKLSNSERSYLDLGEQKNVSKRYKCRIRDPWYAVPSVWAPDGLLLRQAGEMPRLVHLSKKYAATDTIHRVTWRTPSLGRRHAASFMNTWTLMAAEITGRSYGGGVLELMPSEANQLPMPEPKANLDKVFGAVDESVRSRNFYDAVSIVDNLVMPKWMSGAEKCSAESILRNLISRRKTRNV